MTRREVEWTDQERGYAQALLEFEAGKCGGCGDQLSETTKLENEFAYNGQVHSLRCHKCTAIEIAQAKVTGKKNYPHPGALVWFVGPRSTL